MAKPPRPPLPVRSIVVVVVVVPAAAAAVGPEEPTGPAPDWGPTCRKKEGASSP